MQTEHSELNEHESMDINNLMLSLHIPSLSMIVTVVVSELMVTGKQVGISLIAMVNILSPSCIMLSIMSTSNDDDVIPAVIVTLYTSD